MTMKRAFACAACLPLLLLAPGSSVAAASDPIVGITGGRIAGVDDDAVRV